MHAITMSARRGYPCPEAACSAVDAVTALRDAVGVTTSRRKRMEAAELKTTNQLAVERTDMGTARTLMAPDRTLMAWIRTSLSMLSLASRSTNFFST
jgi:hypothetical protein